MRRTFSRGLLLAAGVATAASGAQPAAERFEYSSYQEVETLFVKLDYTPEAWQAGIRAVPRVYLSHIPPRWRDKVANEVSVATKKRIFFRALAPLVLRANELIAKERERLQRVVRQSTRSSAEDKWLGQLAARYKVVNQPVPVLGEQDIRELLMRVDSIPTSLALAQAAEESGWGTSRFAALGNALFGQWTWGGEGIHPEGQRAELGDYKIAAFDSPQASVSAYMHNLNTHAAYAKLRAKRAEQRRADEALNGLALTATLTGYSERGEEYVESLRKIIRANGLSEADSAYLIDMKPILLVPIGEGARLADE